jgi:hypothetical protein
MTNKKRAKSYTKKKLGRYKLNRKDILVIEKMLRKYANVYEMKKAAIYNKSTSPPSGRRNMPRIYADMHVIASGVHADSIKFLPKSIKSTSYFEVNCRPGILVKFTPLSTVISSQENYATGRELMVMRGVVSEIEVYLLSRQKSFINRIKLFLPIP